MPNIQEQLTKAGKDFLEQLSKIGQETDEQIADLQQQIDTLAAKLTQAQSETALARENSTLKETIQELTARLEETEKEKEEQWLKAHKAKEELLALRMELDTTKRELTKLKRQLSETEGKKGKAQPSGTNPTRIKNSGNQGALLPTRALRDAATSGTKRTTAAGANALLTGNRKPASVTSPHSAKDQINFAEKLTAFRDNLYLDI